MEGQADPRLPHGSRFCRCNACGEYFNSDYPFSMHRVGPYERRRCLTPDEMRAAGMVVSPKGYWLSKANDRLTRETSDERPTG